MVLERRGAVAIRRSQRARKKCEMLLQFSIDGYHYRALCTLFPTPAFTPTILHKSRMRRRARTNLALHGRILGTSNAVTVTVKAPQ